MENLLFNGKTKQGEWVQGDLLKIPDINGYIYYIVNDFDERDTIYDTHKYAEEVIPETIGRFSGLVDKNGKNLFEGDIVELQDKNSGVKWRAVVVFGNPYGEYSWGWELQYIGKKPCVNTDILCWVEMEETGAYCEIIGNIYDNQELLKEDYNET